MKGAAARSVGAKPRNITAISLPMRPAGCTPNCFCGVRLMRCGAEEPFWLTHCSPISTAPSRPRCISLHLPVVVPPAVPAHAAAARRGAARDFVARKPPSPVLPWWAQEHNRACCAGRFLHPRRALILRSRDERQKSARNCGGQHNRLAEEGALAFERLEGEDGLAAWTDEFLALEAAGWKGEAGSALASAPRYARRVRTGIGGGGAAAAGRLERLALRLVWPRDCHAW